MTNKMPVVGKRIVEAVIADFTDRRGLNSSIIASLLFKEPADNEPKANETTNPVDFKKEEVNEIERALEELKNILMKATLSNVYYYEQYKEMKELAQNLVDALEAKKDMSKEEPKIDMKEEHVDPVNIWRVRWLC